MEYKYVMCNGFAFSEESDMERLSKYARDGWILVGIARGFFYKLKKDNPRDIIYSLDYQSEADEEYFNLFSQAGWTHVISLGNQTHIFSAPSGTKPIYSDRESEIEKYSRMRKLTRKGTIYSFITLVLLTILLFVSAVKIRPIFIIILLLLIVNIFVFIPYCMVYNAYNSRLNGLKKGRKGEAYNNKLVPGLYAFAGIAFLFLGFIENYQTLYIALGCCFMALSAGYCKKAKKTL